MPWANKVSTFWLRAALTQSKELLFVTYIQPLVKNYGENKVLIAGNIDYDKINIKMLKTISKHF